MKYLVLYEYHSDFEDRDVIELATMCDTERQALQAIDKLLESPHIKSAFFCIRKKE